MAFVVVNPPDQKKAQDHTPNLKKSPISIISNPIFMNDTFKSFSDRIMSFDIMGFIKITKDVNENLVTKQPRAIIKDNPKIIYDVKRNSPKRKKRQSSLLTNKFLPCHFLTLLERSILASVVSELFVDPPDLEDRAEKSSRFFLATERVDPGAEGEGEA